MCQKGQAKTDQPTNNWWIDVGSGAIQLPALVGLVRGQFLVANTIGSVAEN
jgi:hypothetical protein